MPNRIISVIVTAYKAEEFVFEAINSILKQDLPKGWELELIVGVDSCPSTLKAIKARNHKAFSTYMMNKNRGTYITFNTMMQFVKGSIICRFDADDVMRKDMLKNTIREVARGAAMVRYKCRMIPGYKTKIAHGIVSFTRKLWGAVGGFQPWRCGADTDFVHRVNINPILTSVQLKDQIYVDVYRRDSSSLTTNRETGVGTPYRKMIQEQVRKNYKFSKIYNFKNMPLVGSSYKV